ncbi:MAG: response regulator [Dissulfurimicrobium sp.]|uniref:response regulator n=1 Tax=Dissulfurimicrobium TaxID=1769732 RepID=UPI001EDC5ADA|nr:response regulator [Dissulfurimicrobium hydrothermale]UKL13903.1 response regulator [Dissulfurimicrobium hydrothermale]
MVKQRILLVEDEKDIADLIRFNLDQAGFESMVLPEGRHALSYVRQFRPDLILLDLMLPDVDGLDVCKRIKRDPKLSHIPILMVTARGSETDRIVGLELGADDYIVKPFSPRELILRIKAVIARTYPQEDRSVDILKAGGIEMDLGRYAVKAGGEAVDLTATEFRLLKELISTPGNVKSRETLLDRVWGYSFDGYARTVDTHIRRLRKKLGALSGCIETVRGMGYRFNERA